jgi:hypothetical protein
MFPCYGIDVSAMYMRLVQTQRFQVVHYPCFFSAAVHKIEPERFACSLRVAVIRHRT